MKTKRKDVRIPKWLMEILADLQKKYEWNFTETLCRCAEKGAAYYKKQWLEIYPKDDEKEKAQQAGPSERRCPSVDQEDYTENEAYMKHLIEVAKAKWIDE